MTQSRSVIAASPLFAASLVAVLLAGCATRTAYVTPPTAVPQQFTGSTLAAGQTAQTEARGEGFRVADDPWWRNFGDERLNRFVEAVVARNNNLAAAAIAVRRARLQAGLAADNQRPQLNGSGSGSFREESGRDSTSSYDASLGVSYEADLWGRLGAQTDAAAWTAEATDEDRESAALALVSTAAQLYWQLAYQNERIASADESLAYANRTFTLIDAQYRAGAVSGVELNEARQSLQTQQASRTQLLQARTETRNAMTVLLAGTPWPQTDEPQALPTAPLPAVEAGLPAELLSRRPDLRAAEYRLRGQLATTDATRASFYPSLTLTGALGGASSDLGSVLTNPTGVLGVGVSLPFLNWNKMQLTINSSKADYEQAAVNFRQTILEALADVENALSARTTLAAQGTQLDGSLASARTAERLYEVRYRAGAVSARLWLDAQERRRQAEVTAAENRLNRLNNAAVLYQALGGDA